MLKYVLVCFCLLVACVACARKEELPARAVNHAQTSPYELTEAKSIAFCGIKPAVDVGAVSTRVLREVETCLRSSTSSCSNVFVGVDAHMWEQFQQSYGEMCVDDVEFDGEASGWHRLMIFLSALPGGQKLVVDATWTGEKLDQVRVTQLMQ